MKKTWKQWIAIACVLSMIACMLPAMTLAEDGVATPTDLAPITEEPAGEDPAEEPGEEPGEEPAEEIPGPGIPVLQFGNPGYKGTLKAGVDFTIVLHSDRYANILVTLALSPKNGQAADTEGVKVLFNEKARKLVRAEKEDADSIDLQFEAYIAQDTDYTFVITSPFDADFILTAGNRTAAAAEQEDEEEEPEEEPEEKEPTEEETEEEPTEEEPEEEAPAEEKPEEKEPAEKEPEETENAEDENKDGDEDNNPKEPDEVTITEIFEEEVNTVRAWISTDDDQSGETITLKANAEPELEGVPTWYVRNEQVEEGAWKKAGYGEHMTFETTKGNEFRFILPDGTISEVFRLKAAEEAAEEAPEDADTEAWEMEDDEKLLSLGYYKVQVIKRNGANVYSSIGGSSETIKNYAHGKEVWVKATQNSEWAEVYRTGDMPSRYVKWDDLLIVLQEDKEPAEEPDVTADNPELDEEPMDPEEEDAPTEEETPKQIAEGIEQGTETGIDPNEENKPESEPEKEQAVEDGSELVVEDRPEENEAEPEEEPLARELRIRSTMDDLVGIPFNAVITMEAELTNFREDDVYTCQWLYSKDGVTYYDIEGANDLVYSYQISGENINNHWKVIITLENQD